MCLLFGSSWKLWGCKHKVWIKPVQKFSEILLWWKSGASCAHSLRSQQVVKQLAVSEANVRDEGP